MLDNNSISCEGIKMLCISSWSNLRILNLGNFFHNLDNNALGSKGIRYLR
jgi:hypothetical protein